MRKKLVSLMLIIPIILHAGYWQQKVLYDIDVTLIDSVHQIRGHESITYINNSPNALNFIWMHLWPNAYKNDQTALAKQKFDQFSTKIYFLPDSSFGWIDITNVLADSDTLRWEYRSADTIDVAKFIFNSPLKSGDSTVIDLDFTVRIPNVISRLGHFGHHYELTQWYPKPAVYDVDGWHPMSYLDMGEFYSEWADYDVSITLPKNYRVAATGILQDSLEIAWRDSLARVGNSFLDSMLMDPQVEIASLDKLVNEKPASSPQFKTIRFYQDKVHDFAWFADKRFIVTADSVKLPSGRQVQAWTFASPENLKLYQYSNKYVIQTLTYLSDWFMEYPYAHATVVDGDFSAGGGMEYPMITLINSVGLAPLLEMSIMHEVGHNWFYGLSANNERENPWMDEGFNTYAENRYWRMKYPDDDMLSHHGGKPGYFRLLDSFIKDPQKRAIHDLAIYLSTGLRMDQASNLPSESFTPFNYGMMTYYKTAKSTESLHAFLGDAMMDSIWHEYFRRWAYKHPRPEDVRQVFEELSGEDLSWYFDNMLGSTNRIDYALTQFNSLPKGNAFETNIEVNNLGDYSPPLPIGLLGTDKKQVSWVRPMKKHDTFKIKTNFPVNNVILDPNTELLDMSRANNDKNLNLDIDLAKFAINPKADYVVTAIPYLWYNKVDKIYPSLILTHKNIIPWGLTDWYLRGFYGPISKKSGLVAAVEKNIIPDAGKEIQLHSRFVESWSYRLVEISTALRKRDPILFEDEQKWKFTLLMQDIFDGALILKGDTIHYLDQQVWQNGQYLKFYINFFAAKRRALWSKKFELNTTLGAQHKDQPFVTVQSYLNYRHRYSSKGSIRTTIFAAFGFGELPPQERFYISTEVNTAFDHKFILSRDESWYAPGHLILYPGEYNIPGYLFTANKGTIPSTKGLLGIKVRADIPKMEKFNILTGLGLALDAGDEKFEPIGSVSSVLKLGPIQFIYTPVRIESSRIQTDWKRFQIAFDMTTAGSIRIGI
ncbi:MAG: M1 family metallopeptidase [Candidatus Marinimicrobia bacterium]|nr:M1 family metallopeptidase [Candidatus Neomarinimicrobiota bacterium]